MGKTAQADVMDAIEGFLIGETRPAARKHRDVMAVRGEFHGQTVPGFFRGAPGGRGHGQEKAHDNGNFHASARRVSSMTG